MKIIKWSVFAVSMALFIAAWGSAVVWAAFGWTWWKPFDGEQGREFIFVILHFIALWLPFLGFAALPLFEADK